MVIILVENCWLPEFYYKNEGYSSKKSLDIEGEEAKDNRVWFEKKVMYKKISFRNISSFFFKFSAGLLLRSQKEQAYFVLYFIRQMD